MINKNTQNRYFDYILVYVNTILELGDELQEKCKKKVLEKLISKEKNTCILLRKIELHF